jgi:predicted nucleic acid-binding Zn ribbon protein
VTPRWQPLPGQGSDPRRVGASLDRVAASLGVPRATTLASVFAAWADLVGESVAANSRPRSLRDGVLVVAVDQPGWATQLRWLEADLLARLAEHLGAGEVVAIEVRVASTGP